MGLTQFLKDLSKLVAELLHLNDSPVQLEVER